MQFMLRFKDLTIKLNETITNDTEIVHGVPVNIVCDDDYLKRGKCRAYS